MVSGIFFLFSSPFVVLPGQDKKKPKSNGSDGSGLALSEGVQRERRHHQSSDLFYPVHTWLGSVLAPYILLLSIKKSAPWKPL
jgi:pantoate kinase